GAGRRARHLSFPIRAWRDPLVRAMALLHLESLPPRITQGELLSLLCSTGGLRGEQVGEIDLCGTMARVEVPAGWEARLVKALDGATLKERRLRDWSSGAGG